MKRITLTLCAFVLGTIALMAQPASVPPTCYDVTNSLACPITICVQFSRVCPGNPISEAQQTCESIPASSTGKICIPNDELGPPGEACHMVILGFTFKNEVTGEDFTLTSTQTAAFLAFLRGTSGNYLLPYTFTQGECTTPIRFIHDTDKGFIMEPNDPKEPCKKYCIRNESECYVEVNMTTQCLDDPCTDGLDYIPGGASILMGDIYPNNACLDFGFSTETGCPLCVCDGSEVFFQFCGNHDCVPPCTTVSLSNIMSGGGANARICCGNHWLDLTITMDGSGTIVIKKK